VKWFGELLTWNGEPVVWEELMPLFVPRSTWYAGTPINNDGSPRRKLVKPLRGIAVHYTGAPVRARGSTDDATTYMRWLQAFALGAGKSFEYNDIIPPRADGSSQLWEYAGEYMAAHAGAINNPYWWAIQVAIGVDNHPSYSNYDRTRPTVWQPLTDPMIAAFQWRRRWLVDNGFLLPDHEVREHGQLPNAATTCPGNGVRARWADLVATTQPPGDDDMTPEIPPRRLIDTRPLPDPIPADTPIEVDTGRTGKAVVVNVTVTQATGPGFVTLWGAGAAPSTSNVNFDRVGQTIANLAVVPLDGTLIRFQIGGAPAHVIVDLQGVHA
jgi:hypothetical protein